MGFNTALVFILVVHWLGVPQPVTAACPSSAQQAVRQLLACLPKFNQVTDFTKTSASAEAIQDYCATSADQESTCVERVLNDCRRTSPAISRQFDKFVNPDGIREAIRTVCEPNNTAELIAKKSCIGEQQTGVNQCSVSRLNSYNDQLSTLKQQAYSRGQKWLEEEVTKALCTYTGHLKQCQSPYRRYCGNGIGDIFDAIRSSTIPPVCGTAAIKQSLASLITAVLLSVIFISRD